MFAPGDVILVDFPGAQGTKPRPCVVVTTDAYHLVRPDVVVGVCTSNVAAATTSMDYVLLDWQAAGFRVPTAFRSYFATIFAQDVYRLIGHLSDRDWAEVQARLRLAIAVT